MTTIQDIARTDALSQTLRVLHDPVQGPKYYEEITKMPQEVFDLMARQASIPTEQLETYRLLMRGEPNKFLDGIADSDGRLQAGDVVLMTGNNLLRKSQKPFYTGARSSHVALVHADLICVDAMPNPLNVSNRLISEVLAGCEPDWRVMRLKTMTKRKQKQLGLACSYYLGQPYMILPSSNALPGHSYCSELVRKIYQRAEISRHGIPDSRIVAPAHFDRLFDEQKYWVDVTDEVRPAVDFCQEYEAMAKSAFRLFIEGFQLNRQRFAERAKMKEDVKKMIRKKKISDEKGAAMLDMLDQTNEAVQHKFWDFSKSK